MSRNLFDNSDDDNEELLLATNKEYAKSYNNFRKKELQKKYKDRGLDVSESGSDSSSESSSEEDDVVDLKFDQEFFKTLASLKSKDPTIYDKNTKFFDDPEEKSDEDGEVEKKEKKSKPVTLKDYERKVILERNGKFEDDSDVEPDEHYEERAGSPTAVEEERRLKAEFKQVMADDDSEEEEFGGIFKKRSKTTEEAAKEEEDYVTWLAGKKEDIEQEAKAQLAPLKSYWNSDRLPQSERFLRDYILNKGYTNTKSSDIPTYDEIVGDDAPLSEDEKELEKQSEFEHKYNFRFEEPDAEFIKRYPRTIDNTLRQNDQKRKEKRKEQKERKEQEKQEKMKEIEMLKEMKRKEIEEKIRKLKAVTGNDELGFKDEELEEDFDPEAHDRRMQELFNEEYYEVDEGEEKPECPSDIDELQIEDWDNYDPKQGGGGNGGDDDFEQHCEDDDFNMDCDYDPKQELQKELIENTRSRKGRKGRRNRFMEVIQAKKPAFNPEDEQAYGDYIDEYYKLDCEDIVGDIPCRFKYVETTPNDFGLTIEEILLAKNKELNQWASLKKAVQIRPDVVEKKEQRLYKMKAKNEELKRKIFKSLYGDGSEDEDETATAAVEPSATETTEATTEETSTTTAEATMSKSKKRRMRKKAAGSTQSEQTTPAAADSDPPAKKAKLDTSDGVNGDSQKAETTVAVKNNKKKNKNKPKQQLPNTTSNSDEASSTNSLNKNENSKTGLDDNAPKADSVTNNGKSKTNVNNKFKQQTKSVKDNVGTLAKQKSNKANPFSAQSSTAGKNNFSERNRQNNKFKFNGKSQPSGKSGKPIANGTNGISDDRLKAYGINPRKFHKKQKYGNKQNSK